MAQRETLGKKLLNLYMTDETVMKINRQKLKDHVVEFIQICINNHEERSKFQFHSGGASNRKMSLVLPRVKTRSLYCTLGSNILKDILCEIEKEEELLIFNTNGVHPNVCDCNEGCESCDVSLTIQSTHMT